MKKASDGLPQDPYLSFSTSPCHWFLHHDIDSITLPCLVLPRVGAFVNVVDKPSKCSRIECLGHGMSVFPSLSKLEWNSCDISSDVNLALKNDAQQILLLQIQQFCDNSQHFLVASTQLTLLTINVHELVTKKKKSKIKSKYEDIQKLNKEE